MKRIILFASILGLLCAPVLSAQEDKVEYIPTSLSDTVTMLKGRGGNIAVSAGEDGVFIIDDQLKPLTDQLLAAVREIDERPVRFVINTHYHGDHVGGNEALGKTGTVIIAHDNIRRRMTTEQFSSFMNTTTPPYPEEALPIVTFNDRVTLHLNGESVAIRHVPRGHTDGDSIVFFPDSNVLHMGDIFFNGLYPYIDLDGGGTVQGLIAAVEQGLELADAETKIIAGHGPLSDRAGLVDLREMLEFTIGFVRERRARGQSLEMIQAEGFPDEYDEWNHGYISESEWIEMIYRSLD